MQTITRNTLKIILVLVVLIAMFGAGFKSSVAYAATCTPTVFKDLYAKTGTATLYGTTSTTIWGYTALVTDTASLPGPVLDVTVGDCVQVTLNNVDLPEATSLLFQGQAIIPDTTGVTAGSSTSYIFNASSSGTFLYEAGLTPNGQHQVAMGLYGALVVRPTSTLTGLTTATTDAFVMTDGAADFTGKEYFIGGTLTNTTDGSSCTITAVATNSLTCDGGLAGGTLNTWTLGDTYSASATPHAYSSVASAFDEEALLVLSEIDTNLNNSGAPATFDMRNYNPRYFLINGKAYPGTLPFDVTAGARVLMRYVNAGMQAHAMSTLGLSQEILGQDGSPYSYAHKVVAETIATGQTLDTITTIPASAVVDSKFVVYDANMLLRNDTATSVGGMLALLNVSLTPPPPPGPDVTGPVVTAIALVPNPTNGSVDVAVNATLSDVSTGGSNVTAAEFYIDSTVATPTMMTGAFTSPTEIVAGTIPTTTLGTLTSGNHTIYVRGQDAVGNRGAFRPITLNLDKTGPTTSGLSLSPNPSSGFESVLLTATGDDTASGNSNVTAAEYWVDGGALTAMTIDAGLASSIRSFTATIPAGLSMGSHVVSVRSQDAFGNWGAVVTISLQVADTAAPATSNVVASPNPNNGSQGFNTSVPAVRVTADFSDVATGSSNIAAAEGFLDTIGTTGTGFVFVASDGVFDSPAESGYGDIPLVVIGALSNGNHTIYVHAKDAAGNWGTMSTTILVITKSLYFSTAGNSNPPGVGGSADDADIYLWNGTAYSRILDASSLGVPASGGSNANVDGFDRVDANHFYMSFSGDTTLPGIGAVQDEDIVFYSAGTWSVYFDGTAAGLTAGNQDIDAFNNVGGTIYFSTAGNTNPPGVGGTADDADIYSWNGASFARVWDATAAGLASTANVDGFVRGVDDMHFYLSFTTDTTVPGLGTVQDEDVVFNSSGTWSVYFDGTAHGLTSNNLDIDGFDIP
jgi:FtsP/CotA-like multicopper oxidase with cupredoxin domain